MWKGIDTSVKVHGAESTPLYESDSKEDFRYCKGAHSII